MLCVGESGRPAQLYIICVRPVASINTVRSSYSGGVLLYISRLVALYHLFIIICLCIIVSSEIVFIYVREL
jgi:hypothetical protein